MDFLTPATTLDPNLTALFWVIIGLFVLGYLFNKYPPKEKEPNYVSDFASHLEQYKFRHSTKLDIYCSEHVQTRADKGVAMVDNTRCKVCNAFKKGA